MNVSHIVNLLTTTRIELNSILIMGSLNNSNFIIKFSKTELHTLSGIYNSYNSLYSKCLKFLIL